MIALKELREEKRTFLKAQRRRLAAAEARLKTLEAMAEKARARIGRCRATIAAGERDMVEIEKAVCQFGEDADVFDLPDETQRAVWG